jgi:hypothetical protein
VPVYAQAALDLLSIPLPALALLLVGRRLLDFI